MRSINFLLTYLLAFASWSITARQSRSGVSQTLRRLTEPPIFGRAAITLGIGISSLINILTELH